MALPSDVMAQDIGDDNEAGRVVVRFDLAVVGRVSVSRPDVDRSGG